MRKPAFHRSTRLERGADEGLCLLSGCAQTFKFIKACGDVNGGKPSTWDE